MVVRIALSLAPAMLLLVIAADVGVSKTYTLIDLGDFHGGTGLSAAFGINNLGQIVGYSDDPESGFAHAFLWEDGTMSSLGTLPSQSRTSSVAAAINDNGQIVGESGVSNGRHGFVWQNDTLYDLGISSGGITQALLTTSIMLAKSPDGPAG